MKYWFSGTVLDQAEWLAPVDQEQNGGGLAIDRGEFPLRQETEILDPLPVNVRLDVRVIECLVLRFDQSGHQQPSLGPFRNLDSFCRALFGREPAGYNPRFTELPEGETPPRHL